jgi:hypothetical protein
MPHWVDNFEYLIMAFSCYVIIFWFHSLTFDSVDFISQCFVVISIVSSLRKVGYMCAVVETSSTSIWIIQCTMKIEARKLSDWLNPISCHYIVVPNYFVAWINSTDKQSEFGSIRIFILIQTKRS